LIFIVWFLCLNLLNLVSVRLLFDKTSYELPKKVSLKYRHLTVPWLNFDGRNYLEIATKGYNPHYRLDLRVFFPLFPLLVRIVSLNLLFNPVLVGLGISLLTFMASLLVFYKLLQEDKIGNKNREKIILLLLLFPTSFYFLAFYTESIFLFLVLLSFYFLNKKNLFLTSVFIALATATRVTGLALLPSLFWQGYKKYQKSKKFPWPILIAPLGFIAFSVYLQITTGNGLSIISKQKDWYKPMGVFGPEKALSNGFLKFLQGSLVTQGNLFGRSMEIVEFLSAIFLLSIIVLSYKKIKSSYWLFIFFSAWPIFFSGSLSSIHRYILVLFPIYIYLVKVLPKRYYYFLCLFFLLRLVF